jgi:hypothetical protein
MGAGSGSPISALVSKRILLATSPAMRHKRKSPLRERIKRQTIANRRLLTRSMCKNQLSPEESAHSRHCGLAPGAVIRWSAVEPPESTQSCDSRAGACRLTQEGRRSWRTPPFGSRAVSSFGRIARGLPRAVRMVILAPQAKKIDTCAEEVRAAADNLISSCDNAREGQAC